MATTIDEIAEILTEAGIHFRKVDDRPALRTTWLRGDAPVTLLVILFEQGELVQLRAPALLTATDDAAKPLLFRAMLQIAYEVRLVQFEYDPRDGEVSTCVDIPLEDASMTREQLLRCCSALLDVSFMARDRLTTILATGRDPALDTGNVDEQEAQQRQSQLDAMFELARLLGLSRGNA